MLILLRIGAGIQMVVGIGMWTGHWYSLRDFHIQSGIAFVGILWLIALRAFFHNKALLAVFALAWGCFVIGFGIIQANLLVGSLHWIIQLAHLLIGLAAVGIAEKLVLGPPGNPDLP